MAIETMTPVPIGPSAAFKTFGPQLEYESALGGIVNDHPVSKGEIIFSQEIIRAETPKSQKEAMSDEQVKEIWDEIRSQPSLTSEEWGRAFVAYRVVHPIKIEPQIQAQVMQIGMSENVAKSEPGAGSVAVGLPHATQTKPQPQIINEPKIEFHLPEEKKKTVLGSNQEIPEEPLPIYGKDDEALEHRLLRVRAIIRSMEGEVEGKKIAQKLGPETLGDRSKLLKQLKIHDMPDGSYEHFREEVSRIGTVGVETAQKRVVEAATKHVPVRLGKDGRLVTFEAVKKVLSNMVEYINRAGVDR